MQTQIHSSIRSMPVFMAMLLGSAMFLVDPRLGEAAPLLPTLPRDFVDTTYSPPSGNTIVVNAGGNLQTAINIAMPGDTVVLQAGAAYTGPYTLPRKVGSGWIYIQSSAYASLPPPGTRVSISDAANMPKIIGTTAGTSAIQTNARAHNYRFVGIEIRPAAGQTVNTLVNIGNGETSLANLPHDITFDRCYIHGDPKVGARRGVAMNGATMGVVDSYISDFKTVGTDSQALATWNSPGPLKIHNNHLEAAAENFISGGADPAIAQLVPSDITITRNHFFKPLSWIGAGWTVKNLIEFKNAQRVLVEGNIFENIWAADQIGALMNAKSVNQDGGCPWCVTKDLTVRYNMGINLENGFQLGGAPDGPAIIMNRVLIEHNVLGITMPARGGIGRIFQIRGGPKEVTIRHITGLILVSGGTTAFSENVPASSQFDFRDNLLSRGDYGFKGTGSAEGTSTLTTYYRDYTFSNNAVIGAPSASYPSGNFFPSSNAAVGFVNFAGGNYKLRSTSPLHNSASDGTDVGANFGAIAAAISGTANSQ